MRQLAQARELLQEGRFQEAVDLALEVLAGEMAYLLESLNMLEELVRRGPGRERSDGCEDEPFFPAWKPNPKSRLLH